MNRVALGPPARARLLAVLFGLLLLCFGSQLSFAAVSDPAHAPVAPQWVSPNPHLPPDVLKQATKTHAHDQAVRKQTPRKPLRDAGKAGMYGTAGRYASGALVSGTKDMPCVLIGFPDQKGTYNSTLFQRLLFTPRGVPTGSLTDYYAENSYGQFTVDGTVVGWYTTQNPKAAYGNGAGDIASTYAAYEAAAQADAAGLDWAKYDSDHDGYVDALWVVHSGVGAEETNSGYDIWSHSWNFSSAAAYDSSFPGAYVTRTDDPYHPGQKIKIDSYIIMPEQSYYAGGAGQRSTLVGIGVFCHEFGHALGLPDLYDVTYNGQGLGCVSLMAAGSWGGDGWDSRFPAHLDAWSKADLGWLTPTVVTADGFQTLSEVERNRSCYLVKPTGSTNGEYFLAENRQHTGFDRTLFDTGLFIYHIDEKIISAYRADNAVNIGGRPYGVALEEADALASGYDGGHLYRGQSLGNAGDAWPNGEVRDFSADSVPNTAANDGSPMACAIGLIPDKSKAMTCLLQVNPITLATSDALIVDSTGNGNGNSAVEPGEQVSLYWTLFNQGGTAYTNVRGQLISRSSRVTVLEGATTFSNIPAYGSAFEASGFRVAVDLTCGTSALPFALLVTSDQGSALLYVDVNVGLPPTTIFAEDAEQTAASANWSHHAVAGTDTWAVVDPLTDANAQYAHSPTHCWRALDPATTSDQWLVSPSITVPVAYAARLRFWHTYRMERNYDGGQLLVSTNGTDFAPIEAGNFLQGGYSHSLVDGLGGPGWSGGSLGPMSEVVVDISAYMGQTVTFAWRAASDVSVAGTGWYVDDISVEYVLLGSVAAVQVTSPAEGDMIATGTVVPIAWQSSLSPASNVKIELYKGGVFSSSIVATTPNDGSYSWAMPASVADGDDYSIRITSLANPQVWDANNKPFSIKHLWVTAPNGGEQIEAGTEVTITWVSSPTVTDNVKIEALIDGQLDGVIVDSTPNTGSYTVEIPTDAVPLDSYQIRVTSLGAVPYTDGSDDTFAILQPASQPDLLIQRLTDTVAVGDGIYNTTGEDQTVAKCAAPGSTVSYLITVQNDGSNDDEIDLRFRFGTSAGTAAAPTWSVRSTSGAKLASSAVGGASAAQVLLRPMLESTVILDVDAGIAGSVSTVTVTGTSAAMPTRADAVKAAVKAVAPLTAVTLTTNKTSPQLLGAAITLTAAATGGGDVRYQFAVSTNGTAWTVLQDFATGNTCTWTPAAGGTYTLRVVAKDAFTTPAETVSSTKSFTVTANPLTAVTLTSSLASPQFSGKAVTFTATPTGGARVEYQFWVRKCWDPYQMVQDYSTKNTYDWTTPATAGKYAVLVYAREIGTTTAKSTAMFFDVVQPLSAVALSSSLTSPQLPGQSVIFTATPTGGARVEYQFWVRKCWDPYQMVQDYSSRNTYSWTTPATAGKYAVLVYAREVGTTTAKTASMFFDVSPAPVTAVSLATNAASRQVGSAVQLTASTADSGPVEYQFWVRKCWEPYRLLQDYSAANTATWNPEASGSYILMVYARRPGSTKAYEVSSSVPYTVP